MPKAGPSEVRIYCLCGQKMRISSAMFGKPGKCIACRQKIRIPLPEEIPGDGDEIYLKDHPELLRSPEEPKQPYKSDPGKQAPRKKNRRKKEPAAPAVVPLDVLEPLRILCNFEYKIEKKLKTLKTPGPEGDQDSDRESLMGYRVLVQNLRKDLDNQMRARLRELNEQLNDIKEQIARPTMAVRIGEMDYPTFVETIRPLRKRREILYRRRRNLEGWLVVTNRDDAGGFLEVKLQDIPCEPLEFKFPPNPDSGQSVINYAVDGLREAFKAREHCDRKLNEWKRMNKEEAVSPTIVEHTWAETKATRARAKGAIVFFRERLARLVQDYTNDVRAIKAQLEIGREQLKAGDIEKRIFQPLEIDLLRSQADNVQANDYLKRVINANSTADAPPIRGTFIERLDQPVGKKGIGLDSWIAWAASALMILTIFAPISNARVGGNMVPVPGLVMALFVGAGILAMLATIPKREQRGTTISLFWMVAAIFTVTYVHELRYDLGEVGVAIRNDPRWLFQPGILLLTVDILLTAIAAIVAIGRHERLRKIPIAAGVLTLIATLVIGTNVFGQMVAKPHIEEPVYVPAVDGSLRYQVTVKVRNVGWRAMWLGGEWPRIPTATTLLVERQAGTDSWLPITTSSGEFSAQGGNEPRIAPAAPGEAVSFQYNVTAGTYQIQVFSKDSALKAQSKVFTLAPLNITVPAESVEEEPASPSSSPFGQGQENNLLTGDANEITEIELQGLFTTLSSERFLINLYYGDGRSESRVVGLEETLLEPWETQEFDPNRNTLTITNGTRLVIIQQGVRLSLDQLRTPLAQ
jgi:hypothetical protein